MKYTYSKMLRGQRVTVTVEGDEKVIGGMDRESVLFMASTYTRSKSVREHAAALKSLLSELRPVPDTSATTTEHGNDLTVHGFGKSGEDLIIRDVEDAIELRIELATQTLALQLLPQPQMHADKIYHAAVKLAERVAEEQQSMTVLKQDVIDALGLQNHRSLLMETGILKQPKAQYLCLFELGSEYESLYFYREKTGEYGVYVMECIEQIQHELRAKSITELCTLIRTKISILNAEEWEARGHEDE